MAGLLSGCGADNPKPPPLPTPTNTATAPTEPVLPDAAKGTTKAAAVEFVKYYVSVMSYAIQWEPVSLDWRTSGQRCWLHIMQGGD
ncbi:MAG: hypothetical protein V9E81_06655 [Marmoricola sp.]